MTAKNDKNSEYVLWPSMVRIARGASKKTDEQIKKHGRYVKDAAILLMCISGLGSVFVSIIHGLFIGLYSPVKLSDLILTLIWVWYVMLFWLYLYATVFAILSFLILVSMLLCISYEFLNMTYAHFFYKPDETERDDLTA